MSLGRDWRKVPGCSQALGFYGVGNAIPPRGLQRGRHRVGIVLGIEETQKGQK